MLDLTTICTIYSALDVAESRYFHDNFRALLEKALDTLSGRNERDYFVKVLKFDDKLRARVLALLEGFLRNPQTDEVQSENLKTLIFLIED